jgi:acyl-homoserine-lactone acylase
LAFFRRNHSHALGAVGGLVAFASLLSSGTLEANGSEGTHHGSATAEILWDQFGIPHIYGPDLLTVVRGLGYAEMENHAETILMNVASARGRSAEYFGPGPGNANVQNDISVRTEDIPNRAQVWLDTGGDEQAQIIQAFADGANEYAQAAW